MKKQRVGVIYGGRSGEHEISVASAASVFKHIDRTRYEPVPIRIEKDGRWALAEKAPTASSAAAVIEQARAEASRAPRPVRETMLVARPGDETLLTIERRPDGDATVLGLGLDAVFPVLHGPYGEDGTIQGLFELANVAYVGAGVLASSVGMDKAAMRAAFAARGLPLIAWHAFTRHDWTNRRAAVDAALGALGLPVFVKPANLGSSVGISKVKTPDALDAAVLAALEFDRKVVVEAAVPDPREIECAVLGNDAAEASVPGEVVLSREFYDYEAKYLDESSQTVVPADLPVGTIAEVQRLSLEAFRAIDGSGLSRVDFLLARGTGALYLNEINTMPGFTTISMYPKLWEASGVSYTALVDRLIQLAFERHHEKQRLRTSVV